MFEFAEELNALVLFVEHRYYGQSLPFGSRTLKDPSNMAWLSSEQALADYADFLDDWKTHHPTHRVPVVAFGGSYGGMLSAWARMKYPHIWAGAIASSAPVALFRGISNQYDFNKIIEADFTCSPALRQGMLDIEARGKTATGLAQLSADFKTCKPISDSGALIGVISDALAYMAMISYPYPADFLTPLPGYPNVEACRRADKHTEPVLAVQAVVDLYRNYTGTEPCLDVGGSPTPNLGMSLWNIQACNEMVFPQGSDGGLFPAESFDMTAYIASCRSDYGIEPRPDHVRHMYGGRRVGTSNLVFSQGDLDPWTAGCIQPEDIPADVDSIVLRIEGGAHHLDLRSSNPADPASVVHARQVELAHIRKWIHLATDDMIGRALLILILVSICIAHSLDYSNSIRFVTSLPPFVEANGDQFDIYEIADAYGKNYDCYIPKDDQYTRSNTTEGELTSQLPLPDDAEALAIAVLHSELDGRCVAEMALKKYSYLFCIRPDMLYVTQTSRTTDQKLFVCGRRYTDGRTHAEHVAGEEQSREILQHGLREVDDDSLPAESMAQLVLLDAFTASPVDAYTFLVSVRRGQTELMLPLSPADFGALSALSSEEMDDYIQTFSDRTAAVTRDGILSEAPVDEPAAPEDHPADPETSGPRPVADMGPDVGVKAVMDDYGAGTAPVITLTLPDGDNLSNGDPRGTLVDVLCGPIDVITRVSEERPGQYRLVLLTRAVCAIPGMQTPQTEGRRVVCVEK
ncbi:Peptidase S28 [Carpediemonas membranifera]|uniref:Peptidase S28 n=1 Tax=Carpediemonas membranifera TaxID=201153 RepID=A0A8J6E7E1_9EUKA|nr:Peptidase S28 [Carpediemonas membranifera]|eukprot:KAG9390610.1 Peptidase S28 [Carpediemonas membranifera]